MFKAFVMLKFLIYSNSSENTNQFTTLTFLCQMCEIIMRRRHVIAVYVSHFDGTSISLSRNRHNLLIFPFCHSYLNMCKSEGEIVICLILYSGEAWWKSYKNAIQIIDITGLYFFSVNNFNKCKTLSISQNKWE